MGGRPGGVITVHLPLPGDIIAFLYPGLIKLPWSFTKKLTNSGHCNPHVIFCHVGLVTSKQEIVEHVWLFSDVYLYKCKFIMFSVIGQLFSRQNVRNWGKMLISDSQNPKIICLLSQTREETRKYSHLRSWNICRCVPKKDNKGFIHQQSSWPIIQ